MNTIKFYHNGLKINDGELQACAYTKGKYSMTSGIPQESITVHKIYTKKKYNGLFTKEVSEFFIVAKETPEIAACGSDHFLVRPDHPLYSKVLKAFENLQYRIAKKYA
jgi:hypothetical protein